MILRLTDDERDYLIRMLGGPSEQGTRTLGVGLTGEGVLAFRKKVERAASALSVDCSPGLYFDRDSER